MNVSLVARKYGISRSQLFSWLPLEREGALTAVHAGESVVPASDPAAARAEIAQLQRILDKKTMEAEILKEAHFERFAFTHAPAAESIRTLSTRSLERGKALDTMPATTKPEFQKALKSGGLPPEWTEK